MLKYTLKIKGMQCSMCEAHINDTVRKAVPSARKVSSSHSKGQTTFAAEDGTVDEAALRKAIAETGYELCACESVPYEEKKGLFGFLTHKK